MEEGNISEELSEADCGEESHFKKGKLPSKHRHQLEMNHYTDLIQEKEALLKSVSAQKSRKSRSSIHGSRDELLAKLRTLKSEKEQKMKQKQVIDVELKSLNQQVVKKNETCMKLQANVKYKDEQRTNNAIKNLERILSTHQLKLSEEKKLVCEIDALKRSKKTLSEYLSSKQEVDQLRQRLSMLRSERDTLIRETHDIRARENDVKVSLDLLKEETKETEGDEKNPTVDREALKKEIDSLYEKRRELHESYKEALASYHEEQKQYEARLQKVKAEQKRNETRLTKITADRARQDKRHEPKLYEDERNICVCLIQYLEPLIVQYSGDAEDVDCNKTSARYFDVPKCEAGVQVEGSLIKKKGEEDNLGGLFVQSNRRMTRKGSRKGRKTKDSAQKLVLHPHVFEQFFKLSLEPPLTYADVSGVLEKLRTKKDLYEKESIRLSQVFVIAETLASKEIQGKSVLAHEQLSNPKHSENQSANVLIASPNANDLSLHVQNLPEPDNEQRKHRIAKDRLESEVQHDIAKDMLETESTPSETKQAKHEVEQVVREDEKAEHEFKQVELKEHGGNEILSKKDEFTLKYENDEENIFKNERDSCQNEQIATENILNKTDGTEISKLACNDEKLACNDERLACNEDKEILNSSCMSCPTIITDTLEKGMDCINMKETSKEIQVRVT